MSLRVAGGGERAALLSAGPVMLALALLPPGLLVAPRLVLTALVLFFAPGHALARTLRIGRSRPIREQAVDAFIGSLAVIGAVGLVGRLLGATPRSALFALAAATFAFAAIGTRRTRRSPPSGIGASEAGAPRPPLGVPGSRGRRTPYGVSAGGGRSFAFGLWLLTAAVAVALGIEGGGFGVLEDSIDHIATVRDILQSHDLFPASAFYPPVAGDHSIDPRKGFFHLGLALACRTGGADPAVLWRWAPVLTAPIAVLAFGALARRLLVSDTAALLAAMLFALFHGGPGRQWFQLSPYGTNLAQVTFWSGAAALLDAAAGAESPALVRAALVAFAAASVHATGPFLLLAAASALGLGALCARGPRSAVLRASFVTGVVMLAAAMPMLLFRFAFGYPATNPIHTHLQGVAFVNGGYIIRPDLVFAMLGWLGILAVPLSLLWIPRTRTSDAALYLVAATWLPLLLTLDPWVTPALGKALGYLSIRFITLVPNAVIVAGAVVWACGRLLPRRGAPAPSRTLAAVAFLLVIAFAARLDLRSFRTVRTKDYETHYVPSAEPWEPALRALDRRIPEPSVILSDPVTSYCIPAFSRQWVVSALNQHTSPMDGRAVERARDLESMMNPLVPWSERLPLFEKHHVRYVLLNETFEQPFHHFYCDIAPSAFPLIRRSFLDARGPGGEPRFAALSDSGGFTLLRAVDLAPGGTDAAAPNPFVLADVPPGSTAIGADMAGSVRLVAARIERADAVAGGDFTMTCVFTRTPGELAPFPYEVYVRGATDFPKGLLYKPGWEKVDRRIAQARTGLLYRFRAQHAPCEGLYPPSDWPVGTLVEDRFRVDVAGDASAGEYTIKVIVLAPPLLENYALSDYVSDHDYYDGVPVGRVRITRAPAP